MERRTKVPVSEVKTKASQAGDPSWFISQVKTPGSKMAASSKYSPLLLLCPGWNKKHKGQSKKEKRSPEGQSCTRSSAPSPLRAWYTGEVVGNSPRAGQRRGPRDYHVTEGGGWSHWSCRLTSLPRTARALPGVTFRTEEPPSQTLGGANVFLGTKALILVFRPLTPSRNSSLVSLLNLPLPWRR